MALGSFWQACKVNHRLRQLGSVTVLSVAMGVTGCWCVPLVAECGALFLMRGYLLTLKSVRIRKNMAGVHAEGDRFGLKLHTYRTAWPDQVDLSAIGTCMLTVTRTSARIKQHADTGQPERA